MALQYGVPLQVLVDKFSHTRFEPSGFTGNPDIPIAKSIIGLHLPLAGAEVPASRGRRDPGRAAGADAGRRAGRDRRPRRRRDRRDARPRPRGRDQRRDERTRERLERDLPAGAFTRETDAPPCPTCGSITVRNGACYKCVNCGSTTGCS